MDNTLLLVIILIAGGILWLAVHRESTGSSASPSARGSSSKRQQAEVLLALMFAEDKQEWANLKAAATKHGLTIDEADNRLWRGGYFLMSPEDRRQFKWAAAQMIHGAAIPGMAESARSLFAYLRSHGLHPRDCRPYFTAAGMPDMRSLPSEAEIRRRSLRAKAIG